MKKTVLLLVAVLLLAGCQSFPADNGRTEEVEAVFHEWVDGINHKDRQKLLALYDDEAHLHPTLSAKLHESQASREEYFGHLLSLPDLKARVRATHIRVFGDTAINDGFYDFSYQENGKTKTLPARFSYTYLKEADGWKIVSHHSSVLPKKGR